MILLCAAGQETSLLSYAPLAWFSRMKGFFNVLDYTCKYDAKVIRFADLNVFFR